MLGGISGWAWAAFAFVVDEGAIGARSSARAAFEFLFAYHTPLFRIEDVVSFLDFRINSLGDLLIILMGYSGFFD